MNFPHIQQFTALSIKTSVSIYTWKLKTVLRSLPTLSSSNSFKNSYSEIFKLACLLPTICIQYWNSFTIRNIIFTCCCQVTKQRMGLLNIYCVVWRTHECKPRLTLSQMFWIKHDVHIIRKYLRFYSNPVLIQTVFVLYSKRKNKAVYLILSKNLGCIKKIKVKSGFYVTMIDQGQSFHTDMVLLERF